MTLLDGEKLKSFREALELSQAELARRLDLAPQIISRLESYTQEKIDEYEERRKEHAEQTGMPLNKVHMLMPDRSKATAQLKYKLLKVFGYDIEENRVLPAFQEKDSNFIKSSVIAKVPFYAADFHIREKNLSIQDYPEDYVTYFDKRWLNRIVGIQDISNARVIFIHDNSMDSGMNKTTDIHNGNLLLFDMSQTDVINNQVYVFKMGENNIMINRIFVNFDGTMKLVPNNPSIPPTDISEKPCILGKVIWNCSKDGIY